MRELIYLEDGKDYREVKDILLAEYPNAQINDASDDIHLWRFEFLYSVADGTFYRFAIRKGFARCCFGFELLILRKPKLIRKWLKQVRSRERNSA